MAELEQDLRHHIWTERYRPKTIDDCVLPLATKELAKSYIKQGKIPNLLFTGSAGVGKTTLAKAICNEIGADFLVINASLNMDKDMLQTKITQFASTISFSDATKVVILDEADYLNTQHVQPGLRAFMEQFAANCSFILTCNFKNKLIEPIHSRCAVIEFKIPSKEKAALASEFFKRTCRVLTDEGIEFDKKVIAEVVQKHFPDFRRVLNELQRHSSSGKIDSSVLLDFSAEAFSALVKMVKDKKYTDARKWVAQNADIDTQGLFRLFYDSAYERLDVKSIPTLVLMLAEYQYKSSMVVDQEINTAAFLADLMYSNVVWK